eukprot:1681646-Lingulodinium_polyedra.AAC.1
MQLSQRRTDASFPGQCCYRVVPGNSASHVFAGRWRVCVRSSTRRINSSGRRAKPRPPIRKPRI